MDAVKMDGAKMDAVKEEYACPNCVRSNMDVFYEMDGAPVHSVLLMQTQDEALRYPAAGIKLGVCSNCGFVGNVVFKPELHEYSQEYESTQSYSPTFNAFNRELAARLIERYDLRGKTVVEIGCGQGEFLVLLNEMGDNRGIGFDPAYDGRLPEAANNSDLTFVADFYSEKQSNYRGDFICCKMTLEHIPDTAKFMGTVRRAIGEQQATVFFQIPNGGYVLQDLAFWDIYYEHCSYFTHASLRYLFESNGFEVLDMFTDYNDQYLMVEARPKANDRSNLVEPQPDLLAETVQAIDYFTDNVRVKLEYWRHKLQCSSRNSQRTVIWGSGSKGVAFLTTLRLAEEIGYAVDINPNRHGTFMTGAGHEIIGPESLLDYRPDLVIIMNPVYFREIQRTLDQLDLHPELITV